MLELCRPRPWQSLSTDHRYWVALWSGAEDSFDLGSDHLDSPAEDIHSADSAAADIRPGDNPARDIGFGPGCKDNRKDSTGNWVAKGTQSFVSDDHAVTEDIQNWKGIRR